MLECALVFRETKVVSILVFIGTQIKYYFKICVYCFIYIIYLYFFKKMLVVDPKGLLASIYIYLLHFEEHFYLGFLFVYHSEALW